MSDPLLSIPGLGGFLAARDRHAQQQAQQMAQAASLAGLLHQQEQMQMARETAPLQRRLLEAQVNSAQSQDAERQRKEQFFSNPEKFMIPGVPEIAAPSVELGGGPGKPAVAPRIDYGRMLVEGVKSGVIGPEKLLEHQMNIEQKIADREQRMQIVQEQLAQKNLDGQTQAALRREALQLQAMIAQGQQAIAGMTAQTARMGLQMRAEDLQYRQNRDLQEKASKGAHDLSTSLDKDNFTGLLSTTRMLNDTLDKYSPTDVPGVGYAKNLGLSNFFLSPQGKIVKSQVQAVSNDLLKLYSGGAVTLNEGERRTIEQMSSGAFSAQDLYNAWPTVVGRVNAVLGNKTAGVNPDALKEYTSRPGAVKLDLITPSQGKKATPTVENPAGEWSIRKK